MFDPKKLEQVAKQIQDAMPQPVKDLGNDVEQKVRQVIQSQLGKLDVVNREEFEVQTQVLLRTRQKLNELEHKMAELETKLSAEDKSDNA
ncbi:ubiquinone biosynthesis accessory factor UbiK [Photobacterium leiognathi]|uniref:ubiquinone biosynthesis accessory factor UbiK n=1 Tax=Photobacterium leiognathi TaxID=553611 RepID=UPI0029815435|nr:accessory factor UbiK family protein [Photobacterium leiognathi]